MIFWKRSTFRRVRNGIRKPAKSLLSLPRVPLFNKLVIWEAISNLTDQQTLKSNQLNCKSNQLSHKSNQLNCKITKNFGNTGSNVAGTAKDTSTSS